MHAGAPHTDDALYSDDVSSDGYGMMPGSPGSFFPSGVFRDVGREMMGQEDERAREQELGQIRIQSYEQQMNLDRDIDDQRLQALNDLALGIDTKTKAFFGSCREALKNQKDMVGSEEGENWCHHVICGTEQCNSMIRLLDSNTDDSVIDGDAVFFHDQPSDIEKKAGMPKYRDQYAESSHMIYFAEGGVQQGFSLLRAKRIVIFGPLDQNSTPTVTFESPLKLPKVPFTPEFAPFIVVYDVLGSFNVEHFPDERSAIHASKKSSHNSVVFEHQERGLTEKGRHPSTMLDRCNAITEYVRRDMKIPALGACSEENVVRIAAVEFYKVTFRGHMKNKAGGFRLRSHDGKQNFGRLMTPEERPKEIKAGHVAGQEEEEGKEGEEKEECLKDSAHFEPMLPDKTDKHTEKLVEEDATWRPGLVAGGSFLLVNGVIVEANAGIGIMSAIYGTSISAALGWPVLLPTVAAAVVIGGVGAGVAKVVHEITKE